MSDVQLEEIESNLKTIFPQLKNLSSISMLGDGWGNIVVEGNNKMIFRIPKNDFVQKQNKAQIKILPLLAKKINGLQIPIPEIYLESSTEFPFGVMGYEKIEGSIFAPREISGENMASLPSQVAKMLLKFHSIKISDALRKAGLKKTDYSTKKLKEIWNKSSLWLKENLSDTELSQAENLWFEIIEYFNTKPQENVLVQGDTWYGNIILDENFHIKGIVDFDKISIGDHAIDFVVQEYVNKEFMYSVINEYKKFGGRLGDNFERRLQYLKAIKALEDLNFCLYIKYMYPHIPKRVRDSFLIN